MAHKYTPEQHAFFREAAHGRSYKEIQAMFADRFGVELTQAAVKSYMSNHNLKTGTYRKYNQDHVNWLKENIPGTPFKDLTQGFNECFGFSIGVSAMISLCDRFGLHNGIESKFNTGWEPTQFKKGHIPANKGKKGVSYPGTEATQFKKGHVPANHRPVGSERTNVYGYVELKTAEPKTWRAKHVTIWEAANGPVPTGHALIFADGNKLNFTLDNLLLVSRKQLAVLNKFKLIGVYKDLTQSGILAADILMKCTELRKGAQKKPPGMRQHPRAARERNQ